MKSKYYISAFIAILSIVGFPQASLLAQDDPFTVCSGQRSVEYSVNGQEGSVFNWNLPDGAEIVYATEDSNTIRVNWYVGPGEYTISVFERTESGCDGDTRFANVQVSKPIDPINLDQSELVVCEGESYTFNLTDTDYRLINWHNGSSSEIYTADETELIKVSVTNDLGCVYTDSVDFLVSERPDLELGDNLPLCGSDVVTLDPGDYYSYTWNINGEIINDREVDLYAGEQVVSLTVSNYYDCTATDSLFVVKCDPSRYIMPVTNTFTPNGDGSHDEWVINELEIFERVSVEVFDRWGRLVFKTDNYQNDWDGIGANGKPLPMDAYYYVLDLNVEGVEPVVGTVNIVR